MAIAHNKKHDLHPVTIQQPAIIRSGPRRGRPSRIHAAALRCLQCNAHIQWLSRADLIQLGKAR